MKKKYLITVSVLCFIFTILNADETKNHFVYWENMTIEQQNAFLKSNKISKKALSFYEGKLLISDNKMTYELLDTLTSIKNSKINNTALYFYLFNQLCLKADGAVAEILGSYCQKMILNIPEFAIYYFRQNKIVLDKYAEILGAELYFKEEGTSSMKYNYSDFRKILFSKLNNKFEYDEILKSFFTEIKKNMNKMN